MSRFLLFAVSVENTGLQRFFLLIMKNGLEKKKKSFRIEIKVLIFYFRKGFIDMFLVGDVTITMVNDKEYDGRKYYKCQGTAKDGCAYAFTLPANEFPKVGDVYQMKIQPSDKDFKASAIYTKVK